MTNSSLLWILESAVYDTKIKLIVSLEFAHYNKRMNSSLATLESAVNDTKNKLFVSFEFANNNYR